MIRKKECIDQNWRFYQAMTEAQDPDFGFMKSGEGSGLLKAEYNDDSWRNVDLPHDFVAELPYDFHAPVYSGYKQTICSGHNRYIGWYRKKMHIPGTYGDQRLYLDFDGVFRDAAVWLNGYYIGAHLGGYTPFRMEITDYVHYNAENVIVVRVNVSQNEGWFYEGGGIYRHVYLSSCPKTCLEEDTLYVHTEVRDTARVYANFSCCNGLEKNRPLTANVRIIDCNQTIVAEKQIEPLEFAGAKQNFRFEVELSSFLLWDIDAPNLYILEVGLYEDHCLLDSIRTTFGIRTIQFDAENGFYLNGKHLQIHGVCCHQDFAGVGIALTDNLQEYKIKLLKEMGCNAYRTAHHAPAKEILEACDRYGMLVMDETRCAGSTPLILSQLETLVRRDRNHPCVIMWSIGNEEGTTQNSVIGVRIAEKMLETIKRLDATRPVTYGGNNGNQYEGINRMVDIRGWNYRNIGDPDQYHAEHPEQPIIATEEGSTFATRGIYIDNPGQCQIASIDCHVPNWGDTAEGLVNYYNARRYLLGYFVWTGFDYRGEPSPTLAHGTSSQFGIMDTCGFPKDMYYFYKACWSGEPVLHIFTCRLNCDAEHLKAVVYSNYPALALQCDGVLLEKKAMPACAHLEWEIPSDFHELTVYAFKNERICASAQLFSQIRAQKIKLTAVSGVTAKTDDTVTLQVDLLDEKGRIAASCNDLIDFEFENVKQVYFGNGAPGNVLPEGYRPVPQKTIKSGEYAVLYEENGKPLTVTDCSALENVYRPITFQNDVPLPRLCTDVDWLLGKPENVGRRIPCVSLVPLENRKMPVYVYKICFKLTRSEWESGYGRLQFGGLLGKESDIYIDGVHMAKAPFDARNFTVELPRPCTEEHIAYVICRPFYDGLSPREQLCGLIGEVALIQTDAPQYNYPAFNGRCMVFMRPNGSGKPMVCRAFSKNLGEDRIKIFRQCEGED